MLQLAICKYLPCKFNLYFSRTHIWSWWVYLNFSANEISDRLPCFRALSLWDLFTGRTPNYLINVDNSAHIWKALVNRTHLSGCTKKISWAGRYSLLASKVEIHSLYVLLECGSSRHGEFNATFSCTVHYELFAPDTCTLSRSYKFWSSSRSYRHRREPPRNENHKKWVLAGYSSNAIWDCCNPAPCLFFCTWARETLLHQLRSYRFAFLTIRRDLLLILKRATFSFGHSPQCNPCSLLKQVKTMIIKLLKFR